MFRPRQKISIAASLALAALVFPFDADPAQARSGPRYSPASGTNYCVGLDVDGVPFPPGQIQWGVRPENDREWYLHRYPDKLGQFTRRGTSGLHTSDYLAALADLGYKFDEVDVQDAYCSRDYELLDRAHAFRIADEGCPTPFQPDEWGRRSWSTEQWRTFVQYGRQALEINLGPRDAATCIAVILEQADDADRTCKIGAGFASDLAAGGFAFNKAGDCRPTFRGWFRPGKLEPEWARPRGRAAIVVPDREVGFDPGRESTGGVDTDLVRRAP